MRTHAMHTLAAGVVAVVLAAAPVEAGPVTLEHGNSWARVWTHPGDAGQGMDLWVVNQPDGSDLNVLDKQWFWYRIGELTVEPGERPLEALDPDPFVFASDTDGDTLADNLRVRYTGIDDGLEVEVNYHLMGGTPGSGRADMAETIRILNIANGPRTVHFFQYSDFNLSYMEDTAAILWPNTVRQWFSGVRMSETVTTPVPAGAAAAQEPLLLDLLSDAGPTTLAGLPQFAQGDVAWAFQWDVTLAPGECYLISKDKSVMPTPEPATLALVGLGVAAMVARRRR